MLQLHISLNVVLSADLVKKNTVLSFISHSISTPPPYLRNVHALPI